MIHWREARAEDIPAIATLLADDELGATREMTDLIPYRAAFAAMQKEGNNHLIVGEKAHRVIACYQLIFISGPSFQGTRRAQVESVRVASDLRGQGIGAELMRDAETRAIAAGCGLMQLSSNAQRSRAHAFYSRLGYVPSHTGFKKMLG
ncbi:MAG: GNAT family N-acetyltransferase [Pseudorhodobacter sp.]